MNPSSDSNPRTPWLLLWMLTIAAALLHGYHYGVQDQAIYLPAIKILLNPNLYPSDSVFFLSQTRWSLADETMAGSVQWTHLSLECVVLLWHLLSLFAVMLGCWRISVRCFDSAAERWGAVIFVAAVLALPATGTQAPIVDNHFHPRNFATAAILLALAAALEKEWIAILWLIIGAMFHPLMTAIGAFHVAVVAWRLPQRLTRAGMAASLLLIPVAEFSGGDLWRQVVETRRDIFPLRWHWYEWLGVIVPLAFLRWYSRRQRAVPSSGLGRSVATRLLISSGLFIVSAIVVSTISGLERLMILQPMRGVHLLFLFFFFYFGAWVGERIGSLHLWRWGAALLPVCLGMTCWQLYSYPATSHFEWPDAEPRNEWIQAFQWIKQNTRTSELVALDPDYMRRPGEDFHGFRAIAERSMLADYVKDRAVVVLTPELAPEWMRQWRAAERWQSFGSADFTRLTKDFGVSWFVVQKSQLKGLDCPWQSANVAVCKNAVAPP